MATTTSTWLVRAGGITLVVGSVAFATHVILRSVATSGADPLAAAKAGFWIPLNVLGCVGAMLVQIGLPATFPGLHHAGGRTSTIGLVLLSASWAFFGLFLSLYGLLVLPWLAERAPGLVAPGVALPLPFIVTVGIGLLGWLAGAVMVAAPFVRHRAKPIWVGYTLLASPVALLIGNLVIAPRGPVSNLALNLLSNLGPVLLLVAAGYLGWDVARTSTPAANDDSPAPGPGGRNSRAADRGGRG